MVTDLNLECVTALRKCPRCGVEYTTYPATSRATGLPICPDCGVREALESIGVVDAESQDSIIEMARTSANRYKIK